jgi:hypothetical protein
MPQTPGHSPSIKPRHAPLGYRNNLSPAAAYAELIDNNRVHVRIIKDSQTLVLSGRPVNKINKFAPI